VISDNQEVGLEAATLQRKRNSSLVEIVCAVNITGLKHVAEAVDSRASVSGRGAFQMRRSWAARHWWSVWKCECGHE
jgi:hypothetical protein